MSIQKITPFLWFNDQAEEAAKFYTSIFKNSKIKKVTRYTKSAENASGKPKESVMTVVFQLEGQEFITLNGGPHFSFSPAISFVVNCKTQKEIDDLWTKLSKGGDKTAQQCGWLKDKYGVSWQIVPAVLETMLSDSAKTDRVMAAVIQMKKIDIKKLKAA